MSKINKFFNDDILLKGAKCNLPSPIRKSEIAFSYPGSCFGGSSCVHPCGRFGHNYEWCCRKHASDCLVKIGGDWDYCQRINWETCMPISTPKIKDEDLPNVLKKRQ